MRTTLKLSEIVTEWLSENDISPVSSCDYRRKIELWFRWLSKNKIDTRSPARKNVIDYKLYLQKDKSVFTVNSYVTVVKLFYSFCEKKNYYLNIGQGIKSSTKQKEHYKQPLTGKEANQLLNSVSVDSLIGKRDKLMIAIMLTNGLRVCEVNRINISDFNKIGNQTILYIQRKGRIDKREKIAVPEIIDKLFEDYISCRSFDVNDPLFLNHSNGSNGKRITKVSISVIIKNRLREIGIDRKEITAHSLRHTCGSLLVENGVDVETIKEMLGHSNTRTTRIYVDMARQKRLLEFSPSVMIADIISKKHYKHK